LFAKSKQLSFADKFDNIQDFYQHDKPKFLQLLDQYLDLYELIPKSFEDSYYRYYGRKRTYSLYSMLAFLLIQKILGIQHISTMINIFKLSKDLREYCGFENMPDQAQFTRFKQNFTNELENLFYQLVELTEPLCHQINFELASSMIYDTSGIEAYVTENNPEIDVYQLAYSTLPEAAESNQEIKHLYINGHFCYAFKFGIITNGLGIVRHISFLDQEFKKRHPVPPQFKI